MTTAINMVYFIQDNGMLHSMASRKRSTGWGGSRAGAGRPPMFEDKVRVAFDMEREDHDDLVKIADRWDQSVPAVIRRALQTLLKRHRR